MQMTKGLPAVHIGKSLICLGNWIIGSVFKIYDIEYIYVKPRVIFL